MWSGPIAAAGIFPTIDQIVPPHGWVADVLDVIVTDNTVEIAYSYVNDLAIHKIELDAGAPVNIIRKTATHATPWPMPTRTR
jgi:hypothetical protein